MVFLIFLQMLIVYATRWGPFIIKFGESNLLSCEIVHPSNVCSSFSECIQNYIGAFGFGHNNIKTLVPNEQLRLLWFKTIFTTLLLQALKHFENFNVLSDQTKAMMYENTLYVYNIDDYIFYTDCFIVVLCHIEITITQNKHDVCLFLFGLIFPLNYNCWQV